jgi:hypothetical protein
MLLPYILTDGKLNDDNLGIPQSGNGIPDVLDEARNEVDFWLALTYNGGYSYGVTNPVSGTNNTLYQAGNKPICAWANAANASMLAYCFKLAGLNSLCTQYTTSALTAYNYASGLADQGLSTSQEVGGATVRGTDLKMTAAAFLYNLTGNTAYEDVMSSLVFQNSPAALVATSTYMNQMWAYVGYLKTRQPVHYPTLFSNMKASIINEAKNFEANYSASRPTRRATDYQESGGSYKTAQNVQRCIIAHAVADDPSDKAFFENAIVLEADWGLGRNSLNIIYMTTWTTSLAGKRSIENMFDWARNDGVPGLDPGHTPYLNTDDWSTGMVTGRPSALTARCYPAYSGWPAAEGYFNTRYVWAHSEFTPQQTWRGKQAIYSYLYGLYKPTTDFDGDGDVDFMDAASFFDSWLEIPGDTGYDPRADLYADSSGIVDLHDFAVFANAWNPPPAP